MGRIMVLAGTADGRQIAGELLKAGAEVIATVTTGYGRELLSGYPGIQIYQGKLNAAAMLRLIRAQRIDCLIDASHPFAREASVNAIAACGEAGIGYLRFERNGVVTVEGAVVRRVLDFEAAADAATEVIRHGPGNVLLTIGSHHLRWFLEKIPDYPKRLVVRVLPDSGVIAECEAAGLDSGNIIAIKGPFSVELNLELLRHCNASVMVTKDSGAAGGVREKIEAAASLGIPVIMVARPDLDYPCQANAVAEVVQWVKQRGLIPNQ